jgi:hypothetical protein
MRELSMTCAARRLATVAADLTGADVKQGFIVCAVLGAGILAVYVVLYLRYRPRPVKTPRFLREPPADLPPAVADALFTSAPTPAKMVATLLDLVRRGVVVMNKVHTPAPEGDEWASRSDRALHLRRDRLSAVSLAERVFVYELFDHIGGGTDDILLSTVRVWWTKHPATATVVAGFWGLYVRREAETQGLLKPTDEGRKVLSAMGGLTMMVPSVMFLPAIAGVGTGALVASVVTLWPLGAVLAAWAQRITALTDNGNVLAAGYEALRRYLETFGRMQEKTPEAVAIWEHYLTLAVVLGLATRTVDELYIMPPSFMEYGRAGRLGRRAFFFSRPKRFPDAEEADRYAAFRRQYDPTLPAAHVDHRGDEDHLVFKPRLDLAVRTPFARHGAAQHVAGAALETLSGE